MKTGQNSSVFEFHYEEIDRNFLNAPNVKLTHSNEHSLIQGYCIGDNIQAYQFHPEIPFEAVHDIALFNTSLLKEHCINTSHLKNNVFNQEPKNETFILNPLRCFMAG
jgi:hypothetical protein